MGELEPSRAEREADLALEHGDGRLVAIAGYSLEVPGTNLSGGEAEEMYGLREVQGTSDIASSAQAAEIAKARDYAARYNRIVLQRRKGESRPD